MPSSLSLAAVLRYREQVEKAEERTLISLFGEMQRIGTTLSVLTRSLDQHASARLAEVNQVLSATHHQAVATQWRNLQSQRASFEQKLLELEQQMSARRDRFLAARRDREVLSELYEKHEKARLSALEKGERKVLDDLFLSRLPRPR